MLRKRVWLAALTAAFVAGGMAIAHAQAGGGGAGGGGGAAGGGNGGASGGGGSDPSQTGQYTNPNPAPRYKDERYAPMVPGAATFGRRFITVPGSR